MTSELESELQDTVDLDRELLVDFNPQKTWLVLFDWSNNSGAIAVNMDGSVLEEKLSFKMLSQLLKLLPFLKKVISLYELSHLCSCSLSLPTNLLYSLVVRNTVATSGQAILAATLC